MYELVVFELLSIPWEPHAGLTCKLSIGANVRATGDLPVATVAVLGTPGAAGEIFSVKNLIVNGVSQQAVYASTFEMQELITGSNGKMFLEKLLLVVGVLLSTV